MQPEEIARQLTEALNLHGHGFHYRTIKEAADLFEQMKDVLAPRWIFEVSEFPVDVRGRNTHIDFILQSTEHPLYLVVECKRVNPAFGNWCFAHAPYVRRDHAGDECIVEHLRHEQNADLKENDCLVSSGAVHCLLSGKGYDLAIQVKAEEDGDKRGKSHDVIEEAVTQVLLGMNGLVETLRRGTSLLPKTREGVIVPVILTTATLWTTEKDLSETNLEDGRLIGTPLTVQQQQWVKYQCHQSPTLRHSVERPPQKALDHLSDWLRGQHIRTVPVVQGCAFKDFLKNLNADLHGIRDV